MRHRRKYCCTSATKQKKLRYFLNSELDQYLLKSSVFVDIVFHSISDTPANVFYLLRNQDQFLLNYTFCDVHDCFLGKKKTHIIVSSVPPKAKPRFTEFKGYWPTAPHSLSCQVCTMLTASLEKKQQHNFMTYRNLTCSLL